MDRYICIHGHFYQPPRENPWLEEIELQDSAYPYHDWNERITAECYAPNAASRILDGDRIVRIVNNYAKISFNFGPTLLQWLKSRRPDVYLSILDADRESQRRFSGHGSAIAQAYGHTILPLSNRRDKITQIRWGVRDFESRFGRAPEGMWLPETAVDSESLELLLDHGIKFTILSPYQAKRMRASGAPSGPGGWTDVSGGRIDPSTAYAVKLPSGRSIPVFFYDGPISQAVAFEKLLVRGEYLSDRLAGAFSDTRKWPQLVHIATDGETYGHHHRIGDMGLAYALHHIESRGVAKLTNYGEYLERHPPRHEAEIYENSAWSCSHGVERWRSNCGCNTGGHAGWTQEWRKPLRDALDWLRDELAPRYEELGGKLLRNPWAARDAYIEVILDRREATRDRFLATHSARALGPEERVELFQLLEMQRHAMLMYTSCGWFFDDLSGIETVQVIQYAARAIQIAERFFPGRYEEPFLARLEKARSNVKGDGRRIYDEYVRPARVNLEKVGAHYAVSSLFERFPKRARVFCYSAEQEDFQTLSAGRIQLVMGRVNIASEITGHSKRVTFGVLNLGEHNINGGIREFRGEEAYQKFVRDARDSFMRGDFSELLRLVYENFDAGAYSLKLLFRDQQRRIINQIIESSLKRADASYRYVYERDAPLMYFLRSLDMPLPPGFRLAAEMVLNADLKASLDARALDEDRVLGLIEEAQRTGVSLDHAALGFTLSRTLERLAERWVEDPWNVDALRRVAQGARLARKLPFPADLWTPQNLYYENRRDLFPRMEEAARLGEADATAWVDLFRELGRDLSFVDEPEFERSRPPAGTGRFTVTT